MGLFGKKKKDEEFTTMKHDSSNTSEDQETSTFWYLLEQSWDLATDVGEWGYKNLWKPIHHFIRYLRDLEPDTQDMEVIEEWRREKMRRASKNLLNTAIDQRNSHIEQEYDKNVDFLNQKTKICKDWQTESKKQFRTKLQADTNLYIPEWLTKIEDLPKLQNWVITDHVNRREYTNSLCKNLDCDSAKEVILAPSNKHFEKEMELREVKKEVETLKKALADMHSKYNNWIEEKCRSRQSVLESESQLALFNPELPLANSYHMLANNYKLPENHEMKKSPTNQIPLPWFLRFLQSPINLITGAYFSASSSRDTSWGSQISRVAHIVVGILVLYVYFIIGSWIYYIVSTWLTWSQKYVLDMIEHRTKIKKARLENEEKLRQLDEEDKRKEKRRQASTLWWTQQGKMLSKILKIQKGGHIMPLCDVDIFSLTDDEKKEILMSVDPIILQIQMNILSSELNKLIEIPEKGLIKPKGRRRLKRRRFRFGKFKTKRFRIRERMSNFLGITTLIGLIFTTELNSYRPSANILNISGDSIHRIVASSNSKIPEIAPNLQLQVEEEVVEAVQEIEQSAGNLVAKKENRKVKGRKWNRKKERKWNRKIHTLADLKPLDPEDFPEIEEIPVSEKSIQKLQIKVK